MAYPKTATLVICNHDNGARWLKEIEGYGDRYISDGRTEKTKKVLIKPATDELLMEEIHKLGFIVDLEIISVRDATEILLKQLITIKDGRLAYSAGRDQGFYQFEVIKD